MSQNSHKEYPKSQQLLAIACGALPALFLLVTSTTFLVEGQFVYDVKRILELILITILFLVATLNPGIREAFTQQLTRIPRWMGLVLGLIVVCGVISSFISATSTQQAFNSLLEVALLSLLVLAALIVAACRTVAGRSFDQVVLTLLAITAIAVGIQELLGVVAALTNGMEFFAHISLMHYSWPRFYNQVQAWVLPALALLPLVWARSNSELLQGRLFQAFVCLCALTLHWYIIFMTGGRGIAISLLAAFFVCLVFLPAIRHTTLRWHLPGLLLGLLLFLGISQINDRIQNAKHTESALIATEQSLAEQRYSEQEKQKQNQNSENRFDSGSISGRLNLNPAGRFRMWKGAIQDISNEPIWGIGPMNYACLGPTYREGHPHNFILQFSAEWGLPSTIGLLLVVTYLLARLWKVLRTSTNMYETRLASMLTTCLLAAAIYSCLSGVLVMPASQVVGLLTCGWLLGAIPAKNSEEGVWHQGICKVLAVTLFVSGLTTIFSFYELSQREYRESIIATLDQKIPRFWQQGKQCKYFDQY